MAEADPYADFKSPSGNLMITLRSLADDLAAADALVKKLELELDMANQKRRSIAEKDIPEATDGMEGKINLGDGRMLELKEVIRSSIAKEKRIPAIDWLDKNGHGKLVKRQITFEFKKGDEAKADRFSELVSEYVKNTPSVVMTRNDTVHHATLNSWVCERLKEGDTIPFDVFGIFRQRTAKLSD
jgi:hypothetical protein